MFPETGPREAFKSPCVRELFLLFAIDESFRQSTNKLNRVLLRKEEDSIQFRTFANTVEREGEYISEERSKKAEKILETHGFTTQGKRRQYQEGPSDGNEQSSIKEEIIQKAIEDLNIGKEKEFRIELSELQETFEDPESVKANISLDDVLSKKQKESKRQKNAPQKEQKEYVKNTIAHLQNGENASYILNAPCVEKMMILILAFLLHNGLLKRTGPLIFFCDGAADLRSAIQNLFFGLLPFKIILDWFHLEKKCKERLSLAMKGKVRRNKVLNHITPLLWRGKIDMTIAYLQGLNKDDIKNPEEIQRLIGYFERNRNFIPCYALRQKLGLRVSSNQGEKANDLAVSSRQKHNGMSWSLSGSTTLASVTTLHLNNEQSDWLLKRDIAFQFKNRPGNVAA